MRRKRRSSGWRSGNGKSAIIEAGTPPRHTMERTITLSDDLLAQIEGTAAQQGKSLDQWLEETLPAQLEDHSWLDLMEYGRKKGLESGYTEAEVPRVVKEWRSEQRR